VIYFLAMGLAMTALCVLLLHAMTALAATDTSVANLIVTNTSTTSVSLSWDAFATATGYQVLVSSLVLFFFFEFTRRRQGIQFAC
jgi:hypothetical protein